MKTDIILSMNRKAGTKLPLLRGARGVLKKFS